MKRRLGILSLILIALCSVIFAVGCTELKLSSISLESLGFNQTVMENADIDVSKISVKAVYEDGSSKTLNTEKLKFFQNDVEITDGKIDTTVGEKTLKIVYEDQFIEVRYTVVNQLELTYRILGVDMPTFMAEYSSNIQNSSTKDEKSIYLDLSDTTYLVGNTNAFHFKPDVTALNENNQIVKINRFLSSSKVYEKQNGEYVELTGDDLTNTVTIDEQNNTYKFSDLALNKEYKISARPFYLTDDQLESVEDFTQEISFKVVKGYNVENAREFSVIDNSKNNNPKNKDFWEGFDRPTLQNPIDAIVVHGNIALTKDDLPKSYFYNATDSDFSSSDADAERTLDSLRDSIGIYNLSIPKDSTFTIHGNYFTFDTRAIKLTTRESAKPNTPITDLSTLTANTALFTVGGGGYDLSTSCYASDASTLMGSFVINNMKFIGNAQIKEQDYTNPEQYVGALSLTHDRTTSFICNNVINQCFKTTYFTFGNLTLNNCKGYDAFNSYIHIWATHNETSGLSTGKNNVVNNCLFKNSSGPIFMLTQSGTSAEPQLEVNDSVMSTRVTASDPWFATYGFSDMVTDLLAVNNVFLQASSGTKAFAENGTAVNFISVIKGSENGAGATKGYVTVKENGNVVGGTNASISSALSAYAAAPAFATTSTTAIFNGSTLVPVNGAIEGLFVGKFMSIYPAGSSRLCCMLEYFDVVA